MKMNREQLIESINKEIMDKIALFFVVLNNAVPEIDEKYYEMKKHKKYLWNDLTENYYKMWYKMVNMMRTQIDDWKKRLTSFRCVQCEKKFEKWDEFLEHLKEIEDCKQTTLLAKCHKCMKVKICNFYFDEKNQLKAICQDCRDEKSDKNKCIF